MLSEISSVAGKTVASVEESPRDPKYGGEDHGTVLIHFTDGTALTIEGHSYEEVSQSVTPLSAADMRRRKAGVQGQREKTRLERLKREEWLAVSCEERASRREKRKSRFGYLIDEQMQGLMLDTMLSSRRMLFGDDQPLTVRTPCDRCGERLCENAGTRTYPAYPRSEFDWGGGFTVQVEGG